MDRTPLYVILHGGRMGTRYESIEIRKKKNKGRKHDVRSRKRVHEDGIVRYRFFVFVTDGLRRNALLSKANETESIFCFEASEGFALESRRTKNGSWFSRFSRRTCQRSVRFSIRKERDVRSNGSHIEASIANGRIMTNATIGNEPSERIAREHVGRPLRKTDDVYVRTKRVRVLPHLPRRNRNDAFECKDEDGPRDRHRYRSRSMRETIGSLRVRNVAQTFVQGRRRSKFRSMIRKARTTSSGMQSTEPRFVPRNRLHATGLIVPRLEEMPAHVEFVLGTRPDRWSQTWPMFHNGPVRTTTWRSVLEKKRVGSRLQWWMRLQWTIPRGTASWGGVNEHMVRAHFLGCVIRRMRSSQFAICNVFLHRSDFCQARRWITRWTCVIPSSKSVPQTKPGHESLQCLNSTMERQKNHSTSCETEEVKSIAHSCVGACPCPRPHVKSTTDGKNAMDALCTNTQKNQSAFFFHFSGKTRPKQKFRAKPGHKAMSYLALQKGEECMRRVYELALAKGGDFFKPINRRVSDGIEITYNWEPRSTNASMIEFIYNLFWNVKRNSLRSFLTFVGKSWPSNKLYFIL